MRGGLNRKNLKLRMIGANLMKKHTGKIGLMLAAGLVAAMIIPGVAAATVITFDALTIDDDSIGAYPASETGPLTIDGFTFANSVRNDTSLFFLSAYNPDNADQGGATLFAGLAPNYNTLTISAADGGNFLFNAIDLTDFSNGLYRDPRRFYWFDFNTTSGATNEQLVIVDGAPGFQHITFDYGPLTSLVIKTASGYWDFLQMDNVSVQELVPPSVPEPASWAMMLGGFGLIGGAMRRRKMTVSFG